MCQFRFLKICWQRPCLGPGARPERAGSIGWVSPCLRGSKLVSSGGGGGYLPRPIHGEISALGFQAGRPGPPALESLGPNDKPFLKELKCYLQLSWSIRPVFSLPGQKGGFPIPSKTPPPVIAKSSIRLSFYPGGTAASLTLWPSISRVVFAYVDLR